MTTFPPLSVVARDTWTACQVMESDRSAYDAEDVRRAWDFLLKVYRDHPNPNLRAIAARHLPISSQVIIPGGVA